MGCGFILVNSLKYDSLVGDGGVLTLWELMHDVILCFPSFFFPSVYLPKSFTLPTPEL